MKHAYIITSKEMPEIAKPECKRATRRAKRQEEHWPCSACSASIRTVTAPDFARRAAVRWHSLARRAGTWPDLERRFVTIVTHDSGSKFQVLALPRQCSQESSRQLHPRRTPCPRLGQ